MTNDFRNMIKNDLLAQRTLSESTLKTYSSILYNIIKKLGLPMEMKSFDQTSKILEHISQNDKPQSRKTALSGLFVLTGDSKYQEQMAKDIKVVNDNYKDRKMSPERKAQMKTPDQLKTINDELVAKYKKSKNSEDLNNLVISILMSGVYVPPRRLEYALVKTRDFDKKTDNFIVKNKVYLNQYKTASKYGQQIVELPKDVMTYVNKAVKSNESGYLLETKVGKAYTSSSLSKKLSSMFGMGADLLRSSYINHVLYDDNLLQKLEQGATAMGNSVASQKAFYVKDNLPEQ